MLDGVAKTQVASLCHLWLNGQLISNLTQQPHISFRKKKWPEIDIIGVFFFRLSTGDFPGIYYDSKSGGHKIITYSLITFTRTVGRLVVY